MLLPVTLFGWYLLALGAAGFVAHYYLLAYHGYTTLAQMAIVILSGINMFLGLVFIFIRKIFFVVIQLLLLFVLKRMEKNFSASLKNMADELNRMRVSLE